MQVASHVSPARPVPAVVPLVPRDRLLRRADVEAITGLKKSSIYALMREGKFPKCVCVTSKAVAWSESKVYAWVNERLAEQEGAHHD